VELRPEDLAVHEVRYYLRLLHRWETSAYTPPPLCLSVGTGEQEHMTNWLRERGSGPADFVLGVNPAAFFGTAKRWPAERYAEVASKLAKERNARVYVTGLPQERDVAQAVCDAGGPAFHNAAGEMTLRQLMAFLQRCNLYLTNDSGAMHIGAALGTPLIAVFGSTDWVTTAPLSERARIVRVDTPCAPCLLRHCPIDHRCMNDVHPAAVYDAATQLLSTLG
jgi:heptosyltransferase-2